MVHSFSLPVDSGALQIGATLRAAGHKALLAGGCVRDLLRGEQPKDWDLVTDANAAQITDLFERTVDVGGRRFGILQVRIGDGTYEVARLRRESEYGDGRRPDEVSYTADPREDAVRRDFTINGMLYDLAEQELIDVVGGQQDLTDGIVRAIGDPQLRFDEDHLRLLRAVRFAARLGYEIDEVTWEAILSLASKIQSVSAERITDELSLILTEHGAARGFQLLFESGMLHHLLPEVAALDGVKQPPEHHPEGDVWQHVKLMLAEIDRLEDPDLALAWSVLLHDIGKPATFSESDRIRFHGHDLLGAKMADAIARRLRMSNELRQRIVDLTKNHMRFHNAPKMRVGKLHRFLRQPYFPQLLALHRIDCLGCHGKLDLHEFCQDQLRDLQAQDQTRPPEPLLNGEDLIEMGYAPGRKFAKMLRWVEDEQAEGRLADKMAARTAITQIFPRP